jgi:Putative DNA-binding domain
MLEPDAALLGECIHEDGLPVEVRLDIYRNNIFTSLIDVLLGHFPAVCRVVDARFFQYAADAFIRAHPPREAVLSTYGAEFADFLAGFPPCRDLPYLPDLARLEWLLHRSARSPEVGRLQSNWPVDDIWRANQPGADGSLQVDLASGAVSLLVMRIADDVCLARVPAKECA